MSNNPPNINISAQNSQGKCDLKCAYNFKYPESNTTARNNGAFISLTYENGSVPPVTYNSEKYTVSGILITCPSIHLFNGVLQAGEILIQHNPVKGGNMLIVCIPLKSSSESSTASNIITELIQDIANNAPAQGESTNINISGFTLDKIVPNKPFYSYTAGADWIVFGDLEAISINSNTLATLGKIIKPWPIPTPSSNLFYNSTGPNATGTIGEGIYISCQPTGSSEAETEVSYAKNSVSYDLTNIANNPTVFLIIQVILSCVIFIVLFFILNYIYTFITSDAVKLPSLSIPKIA